MCFLSQFTAFFAILGLIFELVVTKVLVPFVFNASQHSFYSLIAVMVPSAQPNQKGITQKVANKNCGKFQKFV